MAITLTDALFDLNYIALNVGATVTNGSGQVQNLASETVTVNAGGSIRVVGTPIPFNGETVGWASKAGTDQWTTITFNGQTATIAGAAQNDTYCVLYNTNVVGNEVVVPAEIIPSICHLVVTYPLFASGSTEFANASRVGDIVVDIPKYQLDGAMELSLTSSGAATIPLSGMALASSTGASCTNSNIFGTIKQVISGANWYDTLITMALNGGSDIVAAANTNIPLEMIGVYEGGATGIIAPDKLEFEPTTNAGTVTNGVLKVGSGGGTIHVYVKDKESIDYQISVKNA